MKRQLIAVGLAASAILVVASISATLAAPESAPLPQAVEGEPNDTFDDADPVPVPGYATGVITRSVSAADTDLFVINTQVGREYRARLSIWTTGPLKLQMYLYNGDREYLDTSSSSSSYASMTWTAYQDTYYIQIEALNPNTTTLQTAHYQLNIDQLAATPTAAPPPSPPPEESEPNDTFADADPVPVPGSVTGQITRSVSAADADYFVINTQVGRDYRASLSIWTVGPLELQMNLYNSDREYLDTSSSSFSYASMTWIAYQNSHYIQIEALDPNTTTLQTARYQLNIDQFAAMPTPPPPTVEGEPNDTFADADPVPIPGYVTGQITRSVSAADTDYFVIDTQVGHDYQTSLGIWTVGPLKLQMNLYNGDREYLDTSSSSSIYASMTWSAYQDSHYIRIEALNPNTTTLQTANYRLDIDEFTAVPTPSAVPPPGEDDYEPNDSRPEAYVLPVSASVSATDANFYPPPDEDWYAFYVKGGRTYRATTSNLTNVDTYLEVFDRNVSRVAKDDDGGGGFASKVEWAASYSIDYYYIRVTNLAPTGDPDDTYDLIVYEVSPGTMRVWLPLCFRCAGDTS